MRISPSEPHSSDVQEFHRRRLPHFYDIERPIFITWRLYGSLPANRAFPDAGGRAFLVMDRLLADLRTGPTYLRMPEIAGMVVDSIRYRHEREYELHGFVVMPNHVHLLVTPLVAVRKFMHSLKRYTARRGNEILGTTGQPFWQDESYDRLVRDEREFYRIADYIERNPVDAGLVREPELFPWSSSPW